MTSSPGPRGWSSLKARCGVLQTTTDDDRRQRVKQYWLPTLCVGGPVIKLFAFVTRKLVLRDVDCTAFVCRLSRSTIKVLDFSQLFLPRLTCEVLPSACLYVCLSVFLSVCLSPSHISKTSRNSWCMLTVVVAPSFSDDSVIGLCTSGFLDDFRFLPRDAMLALYMLSSCVCPSVCLFVTYRSSIKTAKRRIA